MKKIKYISILFLFIRGSLYANDIQNIIDDYNNGKYIEAKDKIVNTKDDTPVYWYYRGIIFHKLMKEDPFSDDVSEYQKKAIEAYNKVNGDAHLVSLAQYNLTEMYKYFMKRGNTYIRMEDYDDALVAFQRANIIYPSDIDSLKNITVMYSRLNNKKKTKELIEKCLTLDKNNVTILCTKIKLLLNEQKLNQAYSMITKGIKERPYNPLYIEMLKLYIEKSKIHNEDDILKKTFSSDEKELLFQNAIWFRLKGNYHEAFKKIYELYLDNDTDSVFI